MSHAKTRIVAAALAACLAAVALAAGGASTLSDVFGSERWRLVSLTSGGETAELGPERAPSSLSTSWGSSPAPSAATG